MNALDDKNNKKDVNNQSKSQNAKKKRGRKKINTNTDQNLGNDALNEFKSVDRTSNESLSNSMKGLISPSSLPLSSLPLPSSLPSLSLPSSSSSSFSSSSFSSSLSLKQQENSIAVDESDKNIEDCLEHTSEEEYHNAVMEEENKNMEDKLENNLSEKEEEEEEDNYHNAVMEEEEENKTMENSLENHQLEKEEIEHHHHHHQQQQQQQQDEIKENKSVMDCLEKLKDENSMDCVPSSQVRVHYTIPGPLYIDLKARPQGIGAIVRAFRRSPDGLQGAAEASGKVTPGDLLYAINDQDVTELEFRDIVQIAKTVEFPLTLTFMKASPWMNGENFSHPEESEFSSNLNHGRWLSSKIGQLMDSNRRRTSMDKVGQKTQDPPQVKRKSAWQDKVNLEKVKQAVGEFKDTHVGDTFSSDHMKSLWKKMGRKNSEDERDEISTLLSNLILEQEGPYHTSMIVATACGRFIGGREDEGMLITAWYRQTASGVFLHIKGATGACYQPSADDVGAKICVQCQSTRYVSLFKLAETGPILIDPMIQDTVDSIVESGVGCFSATLANCDTMSFQLKVDANVIRLVNISEDESNGRLITESEYHRFVQIVLHPTDSCLFTLRVTMNGKELGNHGDTIEKETDLSDINRIHLLAHNPHNRDIIALTIRKFRSLKVSTLDEEYAQNEELGLNVEKTPVAVTPSSPQDNDSKVHNPSYFVDPLVVSQEDAFSRQWDDSDEDDSDEEDETCFVEKEVQTPVVSETSNVISSNLEKLMNSSLNLEETRNLSPCTTSSPLKNVEKVSNVGDLEFREIQLEKRAQALSSLEEKIKRENKELEQTLETLVGRNKVLENEKTILLSTVKVRDERLMLCNHQIKQLEASVANMNVENVTLRKLKVAAALTEKKLAIASKELEKVNRSVVLKEEEIDVLKKDKCDLLATLHEHQEEIRKVRAEIVRCQDDRIQALSEKNALKTKVESITKELRRFVAGGRTFEDIEKQLHERNQLRIELSLARADHKQTLDELEEYKSTLNSLKKVRGMDQVEIAGTLKHFTDLKALNESLTNALADKQVALDHQKRMTIVLGNKIQELEKSQKE